MTPEPDKQSAWDRPLVDADKEEVRRGASGLVEHARLDAVCRPHSADWMMALPLAACGLLLDNEAVRVAVDLRLGHALCAPHSCVCGSWVGQEGHHGLVCRRAQGRSLRHHAINDIIWRTLLKAGVPSTRKPAGLFRTDGKRPDGEPWSLGQPENIWHGMLRWSIHAPHYTSRHRRRLLAPRRSRRRIAKR